MRGYHLEPEMEEGKTASENIRAYVNGLNSCPWWHIMDIVEGYEELIVDEGDSPQKLIQELINLPHVGDRW